MDNLPDSAIIINKLNDEFNVLYDEKESIRKENEIMISSFTDILFNCSIETLDQTNIYEVNQMYDIIKALKNHESYDMIYWFKRHNINDKRIQKKILNNLLQKIKEFCYNVENITFSKVNTNEDEIMNDLLNKTLYLSNYKLDNNKFEFVTRLAVPNPYWESIIESTDDYNEYFEELICPKSMSVIKDCPCKTCCYITKKIKSLN